jgi:signal transduction histidine kinase/ActR/RegA family two-component response regulator
MRWFRRSRQPAEDAGAAARSARWTSGWAIVCATVVLVVTMAGFLAWVSGSAAAVAWMGPRMKTNTALCLVLVGGALLAHSLGGHRTASALGWLAVALAGATFLEYVAGVDLHIDQLLAKDLIIPESARFPNRMSPNAALGVILLGVAVAWVRSPRPWRAAVAQGLTLAVLALSLFALVGYSYGAVLLYKPTPFIRISPYSAAALVVLACGLLSLRLDVGLMRLVVGRNLAGILVRRLLVLAIVVPAVFGWLMVQGERTGLFDTALGSAFLVVATVTTFAAVIMVLARGIDALDRWRSSAENELRGSSHLISELAQASTAEEVVEVTVRVGVPALGASAGGVMLLAADGQELRMARSSGYNEEAMRAYASVPITWQIPPAVALRRDRPLFIHTREELLREFPGLLPEHLRESESRAMIPLRGRQRALGVLLLTFDARQAFDGPARSRIMSLGSQCGLALDRALLFESEKSANKAKEEFLAMLGHELRNPLAPISTSLELMSMRGAGFRQERTVISRQVEHMTRLVDDLLDVSRITRGKVELRRRRLELAECVGKAVEVASPLLEQRRHHLTVSVPQQGLPVRADPHRLEQVISNLLSNAGKYTNPGGHIEISARAGGERVLVAVRDNGIGMSPELLPHVFDLFAQGQHTLERAQGGLGLGLAIVRSLVQMHGGNVTAGSDGPGRGSVFGFDLPLALDEEAEDPAAAVPEAREASELGASRGCRILVVDDNEDAAEMLAEMLRLQGHEVRVAADGPGALAAAEEFGPALAFLDLGLPVMDGFDVARRLRAARGARPPLVLVAVTGYGQEADFARTAAAGFDRHLVKPVEMDETLAIAAEVAAAQPAGG